MSSPFSVKNNKPRQFASPWLVFGLLFMVLGLLVFLSPKQNILDKIRMQQAVDKVAESYLENLVKLYPEDKNLSLLAAEQDLALGEIKDALSKILPFLKVQPTNKKDWQALWIYYQIVHIGAYSKAEESYVRQRDEKELLKLIKKMVGGDFDAKQIAFMADNAVSLGDTELAFELYNRLIEMPAEADSELYASGAKFVLGYSRYRFCAKLYFLAQQATGFIGAKRGYFMNAVKCLQSGDLLAKSFQEVEQNIGVLRSDPKTLQFLATLALTVNQPKLAHEYVKEALRLSK